MGKHRKCPHCGRSFNTDLVDIDRHAESCLRHQKEVVAKNIARLNEGKPPVRRP